MHSKISAGIGVGISGAIALFFAAWLGHSKPCPSVEELPAWFGDSSRPDARISGRVIGAEHPTTVHLLLAIPDSSLWAGRHVRTSANGAFDFGPMRPGRYKMFAEGDGRLSRLTHVDTLRGSGDHVELFTVDRAVVKRNLEDGPYEHPGWEDPYHFVNGEGMWRWRPYGLPMLGVVLRKDGSAASGVGVQPIECSTGSHDVPSGLPTISTTSPSGSFVSFPQSDVCGVRIWMGPRFHEARLDWGSPFAFIRLPEPGSEQHDVFDWRAREVDDPRGAWLRGRVVRDGHGVPDVDVETTVLPMGNMEWFDTARTDSDGRFELFVASRDLDKSNDVLIDARQSIQHLRGQAVVRLFPGQTREGVIVEIGAGVTVSGVVVDVHGAPVSDVRVGCEPWRDERASTGVDGTFRLTIPTQGRCRLQALLDYETALAPLLGLGPKIDVTHPDGEVANIRFVVDRDHTRPAANGWFGDVNLGVVARQLVVQAVGDELEAAGLRVGDTIVAATEGMHALPDYTLFLAGTATWGEPVVITVKRGTEILDIRAQAPTFASAQ